MLKQHILDMYDFTCWGRDRMLDTAKPLTAEQFDQETRFPIHTVKETLVHTLSAEYAYRMRCQGQTYKGMDKKDFADLAAVRARWAQEEKEMRSYLAGIDEASLAGIVRYKVSSGDEFERTRLALLTQLCFHGMQHRAEIAQMLTEFGHSPGNIDYTVFKYG